MNLIFLLKNSLWRKLRYFLKSCLAAVVLSLVYANATAVTPLDRLSLLIPDGADLSSWQVKVWTDSAAEEGIRLELISDSAFLKLGNTAVKSIPGLIVPDSAHIRASDAVIAAIKQYVFGGGKLMLVYDAGVLTDTGFYPLSGNSRFADLAGVDYVFWNNGLGAGTMVGFGPVVGTKGRLDSLSFPPGKYLPYVTQSNLTSTTSATTAYIPTSRLDPSGTQVMTPTFIQRAAAIMQANAYHHGKHSRLNQLGLGLEPNTPLRFDRRNPNASRASEKLSKDMVSRRPDSVAAKLNNSGDTAAPITLAATTVEDTTLQVISGYAYGALGYFHYVTTGDFPGSVYLASPEHGLVAGSRAYGQGQLLFVNMPLGYFKAIGTDGAPLHGFLNLFACDQVGVATLSVQPRGVGGLIYNWHVDDGDDLIEDMKFLLDKTDVLKRGPYSIHFTAGPDVIVVGDRQGMNLNNNPVAQDLVRRIGKIGNKYSTGPNALPVKHELGSHGGWIHDYWADYATEANVPDLTSLLIQNFGAIEKVTGSRLKEYSSPGGNTPLWAINWFEQRGVQGMYFAGDIGTAMVRSWRGGARVSNAVWSAPVSPLGKYATFEEFDDFGITDEVSGQWLLDLQSFVVNHRTNRLFYNHPPGAVAHLNPLNALLKRADQMEAANQFHWYSVAQLGEFNQRRLATTWNSSSTAGITTFTASHPASLKDITWLVPKNHFDTPAIVAGVGKLTSDSRYWIVTADSGSSLTFTAREL